jgi:hypothetical protein
MELGKFGRLGAITPAKILAAMIRKVDDWSSHLFRLSLDRLLRHLGPAPRSLFFWMLKPFIGGVVSRTYGRGWC